jgi:hypothetical protein
MKIKINTNIIIKILIIIFISIIISFLFQPKTLLKSLSPNEKNKVIIKTSEPFLFGKQTIYIKSSKKDIKNLFSSVDYTTNIANDGKNLDKDNIDIYCDKLQINIIRKANDNKSLVFLITLKLVFTIKQKYFFLFICYFSL